VTKKMPGVGRKAPRSVDQGWAAEGGAGRGVAAGGAATTIRREEEELPMSANPSITHRESVENRVEFKNP
jgi:hypothetical protein